MGQLLGGIQEEGDYKWQSEEVENEMLYKRQDDRGEIRQLISYTQGKRTSEKSQSAKDQLKDVIETRLTYGQMQINAGR